MGGPRTQDVFRDATWPADRVIHDSVLGPWVNRRRDGAAIGCELRRVDPRRVPARYWNSPAVVDGTGRVIVPAGEPSRSGEFTQMVYNFGLFFGLAVQAYEATLVSDDTPVDRFLAGDTAALSDNQQQGLNEFRAGGSQCTQCHQGPELSAAGMTTATNVTRSIHVRLDCFAPPSAPSKTMLVPRGWTRSDCRCFRARRACVPMVPSSLPRLRNVELTGPHLHTGGAATLEQVLEFYARNGDVPAGGNLGRGFGNIRLNQQERAQSSIS